VRVLVAVIAFAAIVAGIAYWYTHPALPRSIHIWQETDDEFWLHHTSLRRSIARALHGSDSHVLTLIGHADYTSGAGAYGFGDVLLSIAQELGDERFAAILRQLPGNQHESVWSFIHAGAEYRSRPLSEEELHRQLPKTMHILDEWQPKT